MLMGADDPHDFLVEEEIELMYLVFLLWFQGRGWCLLTFISIWNAVSMRYPYFLLPPDFQCIKLSIVNVIKWSDYKKEGRKLL